MKERNPTLSRLEAVQAKDNHFFIQSWGLQLDIDKAGQNTEGSGHEGDV